MSKTEEFNTFESLIDERYSETLYNGTFTEDEDPMDYIDIKKVGALIGG
ncbi:hypothetical protein [Mammaliicoccus sciuri]|nr:hypothetical protein [Mammaliicoccus sciuri]